LTGGTEKTPVTRALRNDLSKFSLHFVFELGTVGQAVQRLTDRQTDRRTGRTHNVASLYEMMH